MKAMVHAYAEVMKLIRHLPPRTRSYYSQFARENFVTYSQEQDPSVIRSLLLRAPSSVMESAPRVKRVLILDTISYLILGFRQAKLKTKLCQK
jgi:hypothetical protein